MVKSPLASDGHETFPSELLAAQTGIAAATAAKVLDDLQLHGIVKRGRNSVTITNQEALTELACPCYAKVTEAIEEYRRNMADFAQRFNSRLSDSTVC